MHPGFFTSELLEIDPAAAPLRASVSCLLNRDPGGSVVVQW